MKKRSQMEIMGIAIVVIIISIVILFVVRWGILKGPVQHKKEFAQSEIATNLVNTMLSTTTGCKGMNFNELFQDCDGGATITDCPDPNDVTTLPNDPVDSCDYAEYELSQIFDKTLTEWKYKYEFTVKNGNTNVIPSINTCGDIIERKARTYPLPGGLEAKLAICG